MPRKTKTDHSQSVGTKTTPKRVSSTNGKSKTSSKSSKTTLKRSTSNASTQHTLEQNLSKLTTQSTKKSTPRKKKSKEAEIVLNNSRKKENFPWIDTFPLYLEDKTEKKRCWFTCIEHAEKYIRRYNCQYKLYQYTGK